MVAAKAVNITDIAARAGVSIKTVSRVIHEEPHVTADKRDRVLAAVKRLGYVPHVIAQEFAAKTTRVIGFVFLSREKLFCREYFYTEIFDAAHKVLTEHDYFTLFLAPERITSRPVDLVLDIAARRKLSGVILADLVGCDYGVLARQGLPAVVLNRRIATATTASIVPDNAAGMRAVVSHLCGLGHRRIGFLGRVPRRPSSQERLRGYRSALREASLPWDRRLVYDCAQNVPSATDAAVRSLLRTPLARRPTALCCFTDTLALAAIKTLQRAGVRIPDDISVAGFDDIDFCALVTPALTTVHVPRDEMGRLAADKLLEMIGGKSAGTTTEVPVTLVQRESTCSQRRKVG